MIVGKAVGDIDVQMPYDAYPQDKDGPTFKTYLTIVVRNEKGDIVKVHKQWSRSPTANFIGFLMPTNWYINTNSNWTIENTNGATPSFNPTKTPISYPTSSTHCQAYPYMIQVGSGQQSNPYSAYTLAAPIANGSGSGQLLYGTPSVSLTPTVSGSSVYFTISQTLNNQSGGTVTITEVGMIVYANTWNPSSISCNSLGYVLVWYDVLSSPISISNGGSLTIYYTFTVNP
jgi:hypothetical protein